MHAARHQVIAGAFRGGFGQNRGFDVLETGVVQIAAQGPHQRGALAHGLLHFRTAQVQIAVAQADVFTGVFVVVERQGFRGVEYLDGFGDDFHLAAGDLVVHAVPGAHGAGHPQAVFVTDFLGVGESRVIRLGDHLDDAFVVAQVDEAHAAQIAGNIRPTAQGHRLADHRFVNKTAKMATHTEPLTLECAGTGYFKGLSRKLLGNQP